MLLKGFLRVGLPFLAALPLLFPRSARAIEDERFTSVHGTICRVTNSVTPYLSTAGIGNPSTTTNLNLDCPIPITSRSKYTYLAGTHTGVDTHGNFTNGCNHTTTSRVPWVEVYDRNANANADVTCTLLILGTGNAIQSSFTVHTSGSKGPVQVLKFPFSTWTYLNDNNQLYVQCSVPPKTTDFSYVARFGFPTCEGDWFTLP